MLVHRRYVGTYLEWNDGCLRDYPDPAIARCFRALYRSWHDIVRSQKVVHVWELPFWKPGVLREC